MGQFPGLIDLNHAADTALHNHRVAVLQPRKGMHIYALTGIAIHLGRFIGPHDFFTERDLLRFCPCIVKENVPIRQ